jgi:excisionase family DNA binding protein
MQDQEKLAFTIEEAARALSVSRTTIYEMIGANMIFTKKIGRRRVVPAEELRALLARPSVAA